MEGDVCRSVGRNLAGGEADGQPPPKVWSRTGELKIKEFLGAGSGKYGMLGRVR